MEHGALLGPRDPARGDVIGGRYQLLHELERGGTGTVYRGVHVHVNRPVAVKVLRAALAGNARVADRFAREARIISSLEHPHTLKLYDFGWMEDDRPYLVTEFLDGQTLARRLESGPLSVGESARVAVAILSSLGEAHGKGIVHRDLKPSNVFLQSTDHGERVRVLDFGIARFTASTTLTEPGMIMGTPAYMSPEQSLRDDIDGRSDLYSVGAILFECLTGRPPFIAPNPQTLILKHALMPPPRLSDLADGLPSGLEDVVSVLLEKNPELRPLDADTVIERLQPFVGRPEVAWPRHQDELMEPDWAPLLRSAVERVEPVILRTPQRRPAHPWLRRATAVAAGLGIMMLGTAASLAFMRSFSGEPQIEAIVEDVEPLPARPEPLIEPRTVPAPLASEFIDHEAVDLAELADTDDVSSVPRAIRAPPGYVDVEL